MVFARYINMRLYLSLAFSPAVRSISRTNLIIIRVPACKKMSCMSSSVSCMSSSASNIRFRLSDYDCVGFDLDNTIARYKLGSLFTLLYSGLARKLVEQKGYDPELLRPIEDADKDFLQKGLVLDVKKGNILKVGPRGVILRAFHGTRFMTSKEVKATYGPNCQWEPLRTLEEQCLREGHGKLSKVIRSFKDYFDMPAALLSARIVDLLDRKSVPCEEGYTFWPDIFEGLVEAYKKSNFADNLGCYFPAFKENPADFVMPCSFEMKHWLRSLGKQKTVFLVTGSPVDYASMVARQSLGDDWKSYFHLIVTYACKPGFFTGHKPFYNLVGDVEGDPVDVREDLQKGHIYSRGNFQQLRRFLQVQTDKDDPKMLYIGDNLNQDVITPAKYTRCHTVAVVEEMDAEGMIGHQVQRNDWLASDTWGSFFYDDAPGFGDATAKGVQRVNTLAADAIRKYSQIAIPSVDVLVGVPFDNSLGSFNMAHAQCPSGFYPADPVALHT